YNSSNTSHLVELCEEKLPTYFIKNETCLQDDQTISHFDLHSHTEKTTTGYLPTKRPLNILITSGASCPDALVEGVVHRIAELTGNLPQLEQVMDSWTQ